MTWFCLLNEISCEAWLRYVKQAYEVLVPTYAHAFPTTISPKSSSSTASFSTISSLLTLFSKFFSSFLRSTCSLSVSHKYLALEEVYLPFRAAVPNNPTLWNTAYGNVFAKYGSITLFANPFQGFMQDIILLQYSLDYNSVSRF